MDEDSLIEIAEEIKDSVYTSYQLAGVKDYLPRLELLAERLRTVYKHSTVQDYWGVNIAIKNYV